MARTNVPVIPVTRLGVLAGSTGPEVAGTSDGLKVSNDGAVWISMRNSGAGSHTMTFPTPQTVDGQAVADMTIAVANGVTTLVGPFPPSTFNVQSGDDLGYLYIDISGTQSEMKFLAFRL